MKKCKHPKPVLAPKYVCCERKFICQSCNKIFLHQPNIVRHVKTCKGILRLYITVKCVQENLNLEVYFKSIYPVTKTEICNIMFVIELLWGKIALPDIFSHAPQMIKLFQVLLKNMNYFMHVPQLTFLIQKFKKHTDL